MAAMKAWVFPPDRAMRVAVAAVAGVMLASLAHAACGPGDKSCEPAIDDARARIERLLDQAFLPPYALVSLEKLDGRGIETPNKKLYEMRFRAVLDYSGDRLRCRKPLCPELHNYLFEVDAAAKKATVAGWLFLEQDKQGWR